MNSVKIIHTPPRLRLASPHERGGSIHAPPGYPNAYTEIVLRTHLPDSGTKGKNVSSRNHIIVLSTDIVIALPGGFGTRSEIELALEYEKRFILFSPSGEWKEFERRAETATTLQGVLQKLMQALVNYGFSGSGKSKS